MAIDYGAAAKLLAETFADAETNFRGNEATSVLPAVATATSQLFASRTQAIREALIGCCLASVLDPAADLTKPYVNQGTNAYNGRTLDERVVNPFLQEQEIPCSKGPFLAAFRRNISFVPETAKGIRDRHAFTAMLSLIDYLQAGNQATRQTYLRFLLENFIALRAMSQIKLARVNRLSVEQYATLIDGLLGSPTGGVMPVVLVVAAFQAIQTTYNLPWDIEYQGINVADAASGAGGDVTIRHSGKVLLSVEITERPIDEDRVRSTFRTKISPNAIEDYLFFFAAAKPTNAARVRARAYFAQGHEINFASVAEWILTVLTTLGAGGRIAFKDRLIELLDGKAIPTEIKVGWNAQVRALVA